MPDYKISFARDERVLFQDLVHAVDDQAALEAARKMAADPLRLFSHRELPDEVDLVFFNPNPETRVDGTIDDLRALLEKRKAS